MGDPVQTVVSVIPGVDPYANTVPVVLNVAEQIAELIAYRPVLIEKMATREYAEGAASTAGLWRWVSVTGKYSTVAMRGAYVGAAVDLAATLGLPLVVAVGAWVMMGSGYAEAREIVRRRASMSGFSQGFVMAVLEWNWSTAVNRFAKKYTQYTNTFDSLADREEAEGYNDGLKKGWGVGSAVPTSYYKHGVNSPEDHQKNYRIALRKLANAHDSGPWSRNEDEARLQQVSYVIDLASAGLRTGLISPDMSYMPKGWDGS